MAPTPSIKLTMASPYKGGTKEWSNRMHFAGGTPADAAHWEALFHELRDTWKGMLPTDTNIIGGTGYAAGSEVPVWSLLETTAGTYVPGTGVQPPLECCALVRYSTTQRTSKNHPIYLFEYHHGIFVVGSGSHDELLSGQRAGLLSRADSWITGVTDGANTYYRAGPNGAVAQDAQVAQYATHRDFPA